MANNEDKEDIFEDWNSIEAPAKTELYSYKDDKKLHTVAMWFLGSVAVLGIAGSVLLAGYGKTVPDVVAVVTGSAVTAIAALFKVS